MPLAVVDYKAEVVHRFTGDPERFVEIETVDKGNQKAKVKLGAEQEYLRVGQS